MELERDDSYRGEGMPLAYDQIKGLVEAQKAHGAHIDTKSSTMFAVATALVGIAVPLVLSQFWSGADITSKEFQHRGVLLWATLLPVSAYLATACLFWRTYRLKEYWDVNDPEGVKKVVKLTPEAGYESLYKSVEKAYIHNKKINDRKVKNFTWLLQAVIAQTVLIIAWSFLVAIFSSGA